MLAVHGADAVAIPVTAALTSLGYSGEPFDAKAQQQYLRARWYDPANGRFNRLDPFAGNMQDPQSLHKYAYVHGDPIDGIDPSGLFTISGLLSSISISSNNQQKKAASDFKALNSVERVVDFIENARFFVELFSALGESKHVMRHLRSLLAQNSPSSIAPDWAKFSGLNESHFSGVIGAIAYRAPEIIKNVVSEHRRLITDVIRSSSNKNLAKRPRLVVTLPSVPGNWAGAVPVSLPKSVRIAGMGVKVLVPKGGGGSLFAIGFQVAGESKIHQIFRVDYHGQKDPQLTSSFGPPHVRRAHGYARVLQPIQASQQGIGDSIPGLGKPKFHYHVPFTDYTRK